MGTGKLNCGRGGEEILLVHLWNHKLELMLTQMNHLAHAFLMTGADFRLSFVTFLPYSLSCSGHSLVSECH